MFDSESHPRLSLDSEPVRQSFESLGVSMRQDKSSRNKRDRAKYAARLSRKTQIHWNRRDVEIQQKKFAPGLCSHLDLTITYRINR